jgi:hypothetical protein
MTGSNLKNSKARISRFSADDASQLQLRNRLIMLETDTLENVQQSPGLLKQKVSGVITSVGKFERKKRKIVLLGGSHGRGMGPMLQENLGSSFEVYSIFKPSAPPAKVVEDVGKLSKDFTKQNHIVMLEVLETAWI